MNKNAFKLIVGSLLFAVALHSIMPKSRFTQVATNEEQETIPVRTQSPDAVASTSPTSGIEPQGASDTTITSIPEVIARVQESLPRMNQLTFNGDHEVHHVHPAILNAGSQLGHLKELWMQKPQARKAALEFYEQCTFDGQVIDSVRALCYINAVEVSVYLKKTENVLTWNLDYSVQNLASRLMAN